MSKSIPLSDIGLEEHRELMRETKGIIYKITNTINGKVYIGQTMNSFVGRYTSNFKNCHNSHLMNSINKYGGDKFIVEIPYKSLDLDTLNFYEKYFIDLYDSTNPQKGYNKRDGGENASLSIETKALLGSSVRAIYKGNVIEKESIALLSDYMYETYGIKAVNSWFSRGLVPYMYIGDFESIGYLNDDGTVEELERGKNKGKKVKAIYKGVEIIKDTIVDLSNYLKDVYSISNVDSWFHTAVPYGYAFDFESIGFLNEDGSVDELKIGPKQGKGVKAVYRGVLIEKETISIFSDYMDKTYNIKSAYGWFTKGIPYRYKDDFESISIVLEDGTLNELEFLPSNVCKQVKVTYKGITILKSSIADMDKYISENYNVTGLASWFSRGIVPYNYINDFESIGYLNEDGTVEELEKGIGYGVTAKKKIKAIYKGITIEKDSFKEFSFYMRNTYGVIVGTSWVTDGIPYRYRDDFTSLGYLNDSGLVYEFKRKDKRYNPRQKKVKAIYKGITIEKDSISDFSDYMRLKYGIRGVTDWFTLGLPYAYIDDFESIGYFQKDGTISEIKRNSKGNRRGVKAIYKDEVIIKNSISEFTRYMAINYGIKGVRSWFNNGVLPYDCIKDFKSIGYLNEDGTIDELKRNATGNSKKVKAIYRGKEIIKKSITEFERYMSDVYSIKNARSWFKGDKTLPDKYINDFESIGYLNADGTVEELKRNT